MTEDELLYLLLQKYGKDVMRGVPPEDIANLFRQMIIIVTSNLPTSTK